MSGPPVPRVDPSSNQIGQFAVGISPIGTIPAFDYWETVISQYANSPILTQLIDDYFTYLDQTDDLEAFFDNIWNVDSAQGVGLDIWGRIVGVSRVLTVSSSDFLGFAEAGAPAQPLNQAPLYGGAGFTNNVVLSDSAFRILILAKALANVCDGSIGAINQLLLNMFPGRGNVYVVDNGDMTMTYTFSFTPTPVELAILTSSGVLPTPAGVAAALSYPT